MGHLNSEPLCKNPSSNAPLSLCLLHLQVKENSRARSALLHVMRKKTGLRALDVERAAYRKLGWDDAPKEPAVSTWKG